MKIGLSIMPKYNKDRQAHKANFTTDSTEFSQGLHMCIQRFAAILFSEKGTDPLRPWFGTKLPALPRSNISSLAAITTFVTAQVDDASEQFFRFQNEEKATKTIDDMLQTVYIIDIITSPRDRSISVQLKFIASSGLGYEQIFSVGGN